MKKLLAFILMMASASALYSQQDNDKAAKDNNGEMRTLLGNNNALGGYGALSIQYRQIQNRDAFVFGAKGGVTMGHLVTMGLCVKGFFNDKKYNPVTGSHLNLAGVYGGFFFEPVLMPKLPVHVSFPILIGAGSVGVMSSEFNNWSNKFKSQASDAFMVIEPGIEVELNITRFFRFCMGACYMYTSDVEIDDADFAVPPGILKGISGGVTFKFGRF